MKRIIFAILLVAGLAMLVLKPSVRLKLKITNDSNLPVVCVVIRATETFSVHAPAGKTVALNVYTGEDERAFEEGSFVLIISDARGKMRTTHLDVKGRWNAVHHPIVVSEFLASDVD